MITNKKVFEKAKEYFGEELTGNAVISQSDSKSLLLVETNAEYALITIADFTEQPIGDVDLLIEVRIPKTKDTLTDIAKLIMFLQQNTTNASTNLTERIEEITKELAEVSKSVQNNAVLIVKS